MPTQSHTSVSSPLRPAFEFSKFTLKTLPDSYSDLQATGSPFWARALSIACRVAAMEVLVWDFASEEFLCSTTLRERLGLPEGTLFPDSLPEEDRTAFYEILREASAGGPVGMRRLRWSRSGVSPRVLAIHEAALERDEVETPKRLWILAQDLTVADSALQELLQLHRQANERAALSTTLLQEVNHRVKNNLQIVCSLLHSHRDGVCDAEARNSFRDIEARVRMIAHLHDRLSRGFDSLEAASILRDLAGHVAETTALPGGRLALDLQAGALELEIAQAMPFAMIANELLMNAIRHRTPDSPVSMQFRGLPDGSAKLTIRNACAAAPRKSPSGLGMEIVRALCRQLDASFQSDFAWHEAACHVHLPAPKGGPRA